MSSQEVTQTPPQALDPWFLEILACPGCAEHLPVHLNDAQDAFLCDCGRYSYPVRDGIPILLVEEATVLDESISPGHKPS
jgi:uncharacterized protein YbaR (Trm112 family)